MAQTSIHISPVKAGSEIHNERRKMLDYVRPELTPQNQTWKSPDYPTIDAQRKKINSDYQTAHGKKMHAKATPIREAVVVIQEQTTMQQLRDACIRCREKFGIDAMQIYTHRDEGHTTENGTWKPNQHAHIIFNWYNSATHTTHKLSRQDMSEMQSLFAESLGMERGVSSDRKHLTAIQQKNEAEATKLQRLQEQVKQQTKLAAKIPSAGFHIFASAAQKAQIMAIVAEKEEAVEQAQAAMNEAEKRSSAALTRERAAKAEKKKYDDLYEKLEQKIKESRNTGYQDGYQKGEAKEKANTLAKQKELDDLKASHASEIDKLNQTLKNERTLKEFFRETNPYLANAEQNLKELNELQEWSFSDKEKNKLFSGGVVEKDYSIMCGDWDLLQVHLPVRIELKESNLGNIKVWFNKTTKGNCLKQLEKQAEGRYREYCDSKKIEENTFPVSGPIQAGSDASEEEDTLVGENEREGYEIKI